MTILTEAPGELHQSGAHPADPRETMRVLPRFLQMPLTFLTASAHRGQAPLNLAPSTHVVAALMSIVGGVTASTVLLAAPRVWLLALPLSWALTLHGMRNIRMMIYHQSSHQNLWRRKGPDELAGRLCASLLLVQNFGRYRREHIADHHSRHHMTLRDPTVQAILISLGLHPRMTPAMMWRRMLGLLISPAFHARFAVARIRSLLHSLDRVEQAMVLALYGTAATVTAVTQAWDVLLFGWFVPLFPLYQISNTLRLCVEHTFPAADDNPVGRERMASLSNAIFLGEPAPARGAGQRAWARWWLRMAFIHFPSRYLVLTGDTPCHDIHHRYPRTPEWANYIFLRQRDVEAGHPGWPPYREVWGLIPAITVVFSSLSAADPATYDARLISAVSDRELFAAFDD